MVDGVGSSAGVECICVGEEWFGRAFADPADQGADQLGTKIGSVSEFAEAELYGDEVVGIDDFRPVKGVEEVGDLVDEALSGSGDLGGGEKHVAGHEKVSCLELAEV